ncbi:MAG: hypothetical protein ABFD54_05030 [Armatimonadota bacterium]|nr:hypothetical protein [bacterium]
MRARRRTAIELLMNHPDSVVAEMLGIRLSTLRQWINDPVFSEALRDREREQKAGLGRLARQAALNAAAALCQVTGESGGSGKSDAKVLLDILKVSGAFDAEPTDPGEALAEIIRKASEVGGSEHS